MFEKRKKMKVKVKDLLEDLGTERTNRIKFQTECERKKNEIRVLEQNNKELEAVARYLREKLQEAEGEAQVRLEAFDNLRHRIYTLLRSADQDAEIFGLPRITLQETGVQPEEDLQSAPKWACDFNEWYDRHMAEDGDGV